MSVVYYVFMGQEYIGCTFNFNNTVFFKMAAIMADKAYRKKYLSTQTWQRGKLSVDYYVFMGQEYIGRTFNFNNTAFFKMAVNMAI